MTLVNGFLITFLSHVLPSLLCGFIFRKHRAMFVVFPLSIVIQFATTGMVSAVVYRWMPYGIGFLAIVLLVGFALSCLCAFLLPHGEKPQSHSGKVLAALLLLSLFLSLDNAAIYSKNRFSMEHGKTYFRPPLHDDMQRHAIVTNALLRHSGSPLLAHSDFLYQLSWHHMTALMAYFVPIDHSRYQVVEGVSLATGVLFTFVFLWALVLIYPALLKSKKVWFLLLLVFTHTDVFHFISSSLVHGKSGIEADWSYVNSSFIRFWSFKLILLTAPQHAAFFLLATGYFTVRHLVKNTSETVQILWGSAFLTPIFVYSPLMTGFLFLPYWGWRAIGLLGGLKRQAMLELVIGLLSVGAGYVSHLLAFGFSPQSLVQRPGTSDILIFSRSWIEWLHLPLLPFATAGLLGLLFLMLFFSKPRQLLKDPFVLPLLSGWLVTYLIVTDTEIRRHYSMIGVFLSAWVCAGYLTLESVSRRTVAMASMIALAAHGYYFYSYVAKPSVVNPMIAWSDYFHMNRILEDRFPGVPVMGAVDPHGIGNDYPIALEATTSFSMPNHAVIHSRVTPQQFTVLRKIMASGDVANYAQSLGYKLILWGPVEKKVWGPRVERRFVEGSVKIAEAGEVALYEIRDGLRERLDREADLTSSAFYLKAAEAFANERWYQEALGFYFRAVELDPKNSVALSGLSHVLDLYERRDEAALWRKKIN